MTERQPYDGGQFTQKNVTEYDVTLNPTCDTEQISKSGEHLFKRRRVFQDQITTNSYQDSKIFDCRFYERKHFVIKNRHASNALHYKILACIDSGEWFEIKSETSLAGVTPTYEWDTEPWTFVKIQIKSAVANTPALCDAYIAGQS